MSMLLDPESLMFSIDGEQLQREFTRRANLAGYYGADVYNYVETFACEELIDSVVEKAAQELGYKAGQQISKLLVN